VVTIIPPRGKGAAVEAAFWTGAVQTFSISLILGLAGAGILYLLTRARFSHNEFILFLVGVNLFFGGVAVTGNLSPLLTGLVCGAVFANISNKRMQALSVVIHSEKALYIIMLLMLGALWEFSLDTVLLLGLLYPVFRMGGKVAGALLGTKLFRHPTPIPAALGLGLISEGGLSIVMALSFKILYPAAADVVVSVVVISAIVNELISPSLIMSLFDKSEWEIRRLQRTDVRPE
jgi:hypothetical protein